MGEQGYSLEHEKVTQAIENARREAKDLRIPFKLIAQDFYKSQKAIFGLKGPGQYPDFKPGPYRKRKIKKWGFDYPLLKASGALEKSVTNPSDPNADLFIGKAEIEIGSRITDKYGKYHQSDKPRKVLPQRKYLFIGPEAKRFATSDHMGRPDRWVEIIQKHLEKEMTRNGAIKKE